MGKTNSTIILLLVICCACNKEPELLFNFRTCEITLKDDSYCLKELIIRRSGSMRTIQLPEFYQGGTAFRLCDAIDSTLSNLENTPLLISLPLYKSCNATNSSIYLLELNPYPIKSTNDSVIVLKPIRL